MPFYQAYQISADLLARISSPASKVRCQTHRQFERRVISDLSSLPISSGVASLLGVVGSMEPSVSTPSQSKRRCFPRRKVLINKELGICDVRSRDNQSPLLAKHPKRRSSNRNGGPGSSGIPYRKRGLRAERQVEVSYWKCYPFITSEGLLK